MLGSVADAEDVVHEAFIRWMRADRSDVREPEAFLRRTVTRLCLDQPLMLALERLSPLERAAFSATRCFRAGI
jgi:RNA polymerase sigma-70 factor (ECF subfamily)